MDTFKCHQNVVRDQPAGDKSALFRIDNIMKTEFETISYRLSNNFFYYITETDGPKLLLSLGVLLFQDENKICFIQRAHRGLDLRPSASGFLVREPTSTKRPRLENETLDEPLLGITCQYVSDPGIRIQILQFPIEQQDEVSIESVKFLAMQGCAFRGHDESIDSKYRGNYMELITLLGRMNPEIGIVLEKAAKNSKYTSPEIQREILKIIADTMRDKIREEIGESKFCILVDEAIDESNKEQMAIILRYVDQDGFIRERFFEVVHVENTSALTLKKEICNVFNQYNLLTKNLRRQGYDGTSNVGNGMDFRLYFLKILHMLIIFILKAIRKVEINDLIESGEIDTGTGANQDCSLTTRWSSHFNSVRRIIGLFGSVSILLQDLVEKDLNSNIQGEAKVLGVSDKLCQILQKNDIDILNAMNLVSTTRLNLQQIRDDGWEGFLWGVLNFCESNDIEVPNFDDCYTRGTKRSCQLKNNITVHDHYHFEIFNAVIDYQLMELNEIFPESTMELLTLSNALSSVDGFKSFSLFDICSLVDKFYFHDFNQEERDDLKRELDHYKFDVPRHAQFQNLDSLHHLCLALARTTKSVIYPMIDRLVRLVLTLSVSTTTTERAFLGMKLIKTQLRNKMKNDLLANTMVVYIERDIAFDIDTEFIINKFDVLKNRKIRLR
ncbi:uncharacterized protein [Henckelia pumila]|uniref:uncharacterized protein n=1 Tax=Henckelia pumila TaxID=405737 RepID=UPI003C6E7CC2